LGSDFVGVKRRAYDALRNEEMRRGINRGMESFLQKSVEIRSRKQVEELRERVNEIKSEEVQKLKELLNEAIDSLGKNGVAVYLERTKEDALKRFDMLTEGDRLIVKSKSLVSEEIGLRDHLISMGKEVWETDLGEFIIQLRGERPSQMIAPSLHVPREAVAVAFEKKFGVHFDSADLQSMVAAAREFLREKLVNADVGITGANAISAKEGTVVTVENEGNVRLTMTLPKKHIVCTSVEKVVSTTLDAVSVALTQSYFAGYDKPTYISLTSTPSGTGDIEKVIVRPAQGSKEMSVVLVDNGRLDAYSNEFKDALRCIKCGACQLVCPTYSVAGPAWGGPTYTAAIGLVWTAITGLMDEAESLSYFCLGCDACNEICPVNIDISGLISKLRGRASAKTFIENQGR
jgi:L-lactate dehydrogenase complex protein LldG